MRRSLILVATTLLLPPVAYAQEPDAPEPPRERWSADVGFALNATGGNQSIAVLTSTMGLSHLQKDDFELGLSGAIRYGRSDGEEVARNTRAALTFDFRPGAAWTPFVFATGENDPFRKLELRFNGGAGVKRTFWREDWSELSLSGAGLYSHEALEVEPGTDPINRTARWSWRVRARRQLGDRTRAEQVLFWQPDWRRADDYLLEAASSLRLALTRALTLDVAFRFERDSTPAPDVGPDDWSVTTGLSMSTRW